MKIEIITVKPYHHKQIKYNGLTFNVKKLTNGVWALMYGYNIGLYLTDKASELKFEAMQAIEGFTEKEFKKYAQ